MRARVIRVFYAGALSGLLFALLDTLHAHRATCGVSESLLLFGLAAGLLCFALAALAVIVVAVMAAGESLARGKRSAGLVALTIAAAPACVYVGIRLFQGGATSRLPARHLLMGASTLLLIGLFYLASRIAEAAVRHSHSAPVRSRFSKVVSLVLVLMAVAFYTADAQLYRRLYIYLHAVLAAAGTASSVLAFIVWWPSNVFETWSARRHVLVVFALASVFGLARFSLDTRQTLKVALYEHTATAVHVLRAIQRSRRPSAVPVAPEEIKELRRERERMTRLVSTGEYPVHPGAHVLLVTVDALRADKLGVYGHRNRDLTPHLDDWAKQKGVVFERAYCAAPHSSYSISSLHTARFLRDEAMVGKNVEHPTVADVLKENGYETVGFYTQGIFHTEGEKVGYYQASSFGFEKRTHGAPPPYELTDRALAAIDEILKQGEPPSFLWVHYFNVHEPYKSTRYGSAPLDRYEGEIADADEHIRRLIDRAEERFSREVIVVFSADHGEEFKEHGGYYHGSSLFDEQIRVPLIFAVPGTKPGRVAHPVSILGIAPTVLWLVGLQPPQSMAGRDLRPGIFGGDDSFVDWPVFSSVMKRHSVVSWPWKLIADPAADLYELYNLETDISEKLNLYDRKPRIAARLVGEIHSWLDDIIKGEDEAGTVLNLGRVADPRAVPGLLGVAMNEGAPVQDRIEALRLLRPIRDFSVIPSLKGLLEDADERVAVAASLTLGELGDTSGQELMRDALFDTDPEVRDSAALALGRLGDRAATHALVEALGRNDVEVREQAIRMLGRLADPESAAPLIEALAEARTRYLTVLALGKVGGDAAYDALMRVLETEHYTDVRGYTVVALGWLGRDEAVPRLLRVLEEEPEIKWTPESLVRLGAVGKAPLFGVDATGGRCTPRLGWGKCAEKPHIIHGEFLGRTTCRSAGRRAELVFSAEAPEQTTVIVRARHHHPNSGLILPLTITANKKRLGTVELTTEFQEFRLTANEGIWKQNKNHITLELGRDAPFELDHFLVFAP